MSFDQDFLTERKLHLENRLTSKADILKKGGEQALSHSPDDLIRIQYALERIRIGQYGLCIHCGTCINEERLRIIPEAPLCTKCAIDTESH